MKKYLLILLLVSITGCAQKQAENTIRLIPKDYIGPVLVIFNQQEGEAKEYEGDKRVYKIPENGVLKTQFEPNYGVQKHEYYYVDNNGKRTEIPFVNVYDKDALKSIKNKDGIYAYWEQALGEGLNVSADSEKSKVEPARTFYIGNLKDIDKEYREQLNFTFKHHKN